MTLSRFGYLLKFKRRGSKIIPSVSPKSLPRTPSFNDLFRRIYPFGGPKVSIAPVLDKWIEEDRVVDQATVVSITNKLIRYKRYTHALEVSFWMTEECCFLSPRDIAIQLDLIAKVYGIEKAESYFNSIPMEDRDLEVYSALLNVYTQVKHVEKAEAVMQKMRDLEFAWTPSVYNCLLNLYCQTAEHVKLDNLMQEMEEKGVNCNNFTFGIQLSAYATASDIEGIDKIVSRMESNPYSVLDWTFYAVAANGYTKAGSEEKALAMLKKSERLAIGKKMSTAFNYLIPQYAAIGKKDQVLRLWEFYKKGKVYNGGYVAVIPSLLKFDDIESAEKIYEEWESRKLHMDIRILNFLIGAYCKKGLLEKAETLVNRVILKGGKPDEKTYYYMAKGYLLCNQTQKAVEAMKEAILISVPRWKPNKDSLAACLEYLKHKDVVEAEEFIGLLRDNDVVAVDVYDKLLTYIRDGKSSSNVLRILTKDEVALVTEDWRLSQFWYDRETAETVAQEVLTLCNASDFRVACIACPTIYAYLKKFDSNISVQLLEFDKRFEQYGSDFTFYDYNQPEELPSELKHAYHVVVADPPYLSRECLEKVTQTVSFLTRPGESYLLLLTGEVQNDRAAELMGLHPCSFRPQHSSKLGNEFRLFTNYDPGMRLGGWEQEN